MEIHSVFLWSKRNIPDRRPSTEARRDRRRDGQCKNTMPPLLHRLRTHNQLYRNSTLYQQINSYRLCLIPEDKGSSHMILRPVHSKFVHHHISAHVQDTQHHRTTLYPYASQPLLSRTWNVHPWYKFLLLYYMWSRSDNSAACLHSRPPATASNSSQQQRSEQQTYIYIYTVSQEK